MYMLLPVAVMIGIVGLAFLYMAAIENSEKGPAMWCFITSAALIAIVYASI